MNDLRRMSEKAGIATALIGATAIRAVSSAYYAAFHQVTDQVAQRLFPEPIVPVTGPALGDARSRVACLAVIALKTTPR